MSSLSFIFFNNNGLQTLGRSNNDWFNVREQWVLSVFFFISSSGDSQSQSEWNTLDTSLPDFLVQSWVQTDFFSTHVQLGELLDFLDGSWSSLLEGNTVQLLKKTLVSIIPSCLYCEWTKKKVHLFAVVTVWKSRSTVWSNTGVVFIAGHPQYLVPPRTCIVTEYHICVK